MTLNTTIEWTDATWNPLVGCERISPGCAHCYAKTQHDRRHKAVLAGKRLPVQYAQPFEVVQLRPDRLEQPLHWKKPRRVFVNSLSDLFHEDVPDSFVDQVFAVMAFSKRHTFQVLTKRADRMRSYLSQRDTYHRVRALMEGEAINDVRDAWWETLTHGEQDRERSQWWTNLKEDEWPLRNVWLGVSVENQHFADERIPLLLQTPAAVRFISAEPLLGPVLLDNGESSWLTCTRDCDPEHDEGASCLSAIETGRCFHGIDWVIVGGESGPGARPFDVAWARSIVQQCQAAGVACFVKQLGANACVDDSDLGEWGDARFIETDRAAKWRLKLRDKKGGDPAEWPTDLRVREFPR